MALTSLTYVSAARQPVTAATLAAIVEVALCVNARVGITGTLLCTGTHFVQTLEGERRAVAAMLARLSRDHRHDLIAVVDYREGVRRAYPTWAMGYSGTSVFTAALVERVVVGFPPSPPAHVRRLARFMKGFTLT